MMNKIEAYLESKRYAWAPSTLSSERSRLTSNIGLLESDPAWAYDQLKKSNVKPYSIKTLFIRFSDFYSFLNNGSNPFSNFMKLNANLFKHAYTKEQLNVTFQEAAVLIASIENTDVREKAKRLLTGGLRYTESFTEHEGQVIGKGSKPRKIFAPEGVGSITFNQSYTTFRRELKKLGLKPHTLRKLFANMLVEQGAGEMDLLKAMGWESIQTAASYLQAKRDEQLKQLVINPFAR